MSIKLTVKNKVSEECFQIYDCGDGLNLCYFKNNKLLYTDYYMDSSFLVYLNAEPVSIVSINQAGFAELMKNLNFEINKGLLTSEFVSYNPSGISKFLKYCSKHKDIKALKSSKYVLNYLTRQLQLKRRRYVNRKEQTLH